MAPLPGPSRSTSLAITVTGFAVTAAAFIIFDLGLTLALVLALIPSVIVLALYGFLAPWYNHELGRVLFTKMLSLTVVFALLVVNRLIDYEAEMKVTIIGILLVGMAQWLTVVWVAYAQLDRTSKE